MPAGVRAASRRRLAGGAHGTPYMPLYRFERKHAPAVQGFFTVLNPQHGQKPFVTGSGGVF